MISSNDCWMKSVCKKAKDKCSKEDIFCIKLFKINELFNYSLLSNNQRMNTSLFAEDVDTIEYTELNNIKNNIVDFVKSGNNIFIYSIICGNGKTAWSIKLMQEYINRIWINSPLKCRALFINVPKFFLSLKDKISNKNDYASFILDNVNDADLVVWDDIATKCITEYESEYLLSILDNRINNKKSNIFTSNMNEKAIFELLGARLASRIINCSKVYNFKGKDKRYLSKG